MKNTWDWVQKLSSVGEICSSSTFVRYQLLGKIDWIEYNNKESDKDTYKYDIHLICFERLSFWMNFLDHRECNNSRLSENCINVSRNVNLNYRTHDHKGLLIAVNHYNN